ncbi:hypothetical protein OG21DRAFT_1584369 [Imleria badia]|nr:hypothetical protein OG21DRAFT_1584369 [Imleria badia]
MGRGIRFAYPTPLLGSHLCPLPSPHRPHCLAKERLRLWTPNTSSKQPASGIIPAAVSDQALNCILEVIRASWADSTKELYGNALLTYHVYCDLNGPIPKHERCPISSTLLLSFLSSCAGGFAGSTLSNYAAGIKAWHLLHRQPWLIHQDELRLMLQGAARLTPNHSKWDQCPPMTVDDLKVMRANLNLEDPCDAAVYACMVVGFYCAARLGEFTVPNVCEVFDPQKYITQKGISMMTDQHGLPVINFRLPATKCEVKGEDVQCAPQPNCVTDPEAALANHMRINAAPLDTHLFAWKHPKGGFRPLSKTQVTSRFASKGSHPGDKTQKSLRIGGTLFYLLKGVPFDVVKSFTLYLRLHALILAPYLQANQQVFDKIMRIAMPPPRTLSRTPSLGVSRMDSSFLTRRISM